MHLLLVLQTHSVSNSAGDRERFCKANKAEVMRRCTKSLVDSVNYAALRLPNFTFELKVLDDHSDEFAVEQLKVNLNSANFKTDLEFLTSRGIMPSILACYEYGRDHGKDWVYFVQDDYLYEETAIYDMLAVAIQTTENIGNYTCIFPYNDPYRYAPVNTVIESHIIQMQGRHWRTQIMTGSPFMVHHSILTKEWDVFEAMGKHELTVDMEDKTINQLFRTRGYYLFVPIPSLALHMQYESEKDPFINWREWWDRYSPAEKFQIDHSKQNLLHVGFEGKKLSDELYTNDLLNYNVITLDKDKTHNPDITIDIKDLSSIKSETFDCIYANHVLECLEPKDVPIVLKEFSRILKPNGFSKLVVYNMQSVAMYLLQDKMLDEIFKFGRPDHKPLAPISVLYSKDQKIGFTKNIIKTICDKYNLSVDMKESDCDLIITLKK